jgi:hypothetical protein
MKTINKAELVGSSSYVNLKQIPIIKEQALKASKTEKTTTLISMG